MLWVAVFAGILATLLFAYTVTSISRIQSLTTTLGITSVFKVHQWVGISAITLIFIHVILLVIAEPSYLSLLNPVGGTPASRGAMVATGALLAISRITRWRPKHYMAWRWIHLSLAVVATSGIAVHLIYLGRHLVPWAILGVVIFMVLLRRWLWTPLRGRKYSVVDIRSERDGVATVILSPHRRSRHARMEKLSFQPGQFAWVRLRRLFAKEEHPYTIASSAADDDTIEFTVKYTADSFSDKFAHLTVGQKVFLDGPYGDFTPYHRDLVMVAAGVGITPMMSMIRTLADREDSRHMILVYVGSQQLFRSEIEELKERLNLRLCTVVGRPVNADALAAMLPPRQRRHYDYYVCGPDRLIRDTLGALQTLKVPASRIHTEQFFSAPKGRTNVQTDRFSSRDDHGTLRRNGRYRPGGTTTS